MDHRVDAIAEAGQRLVDRVVDDLVDHVVQARPVVGVADVHPGAFANRVEALEDLDALFVVLPRRWAASAVGFEPPPVGGSDVVMNRSIAL